MITGATQLAAVIGWPVEHSRSPAIHNAAAQAVGADLVYTALGVSPGAGVDAVAAMRTLGLRGMSVTMPHKQDVMAALDEITPVAQALGAVNHITNSDGHLVGNNTDGEGFLLGLDHHGVAVDGLTVGVIGAGGAARAIIHACANAGANVVVIARNPDRAASAAAVGGATARVGSLEDLHALDMAVNATPVGMASNDPATSTATPFDPHVLRPGAVVVDIVYNPLETALLAQSRRCGLQCIDGLAMLVGQAAAQFETWTGYDAPFGVMMEAAQI